MTTRVGLDGQFAAKFAFDAEEAFAANEGLANETARQSSWSYKGT